MESMSRAKSRRALTKGLVVSRSGKMSSHTRAVAKALGSQSVATCSRWLAISCVWRRMANF
eukprot:6202182-Pleurochrysis_carterae.AAC.3